MKKLLLLSVFLCSMVSLVCSQNYISFPTSNASWIDSKNCRENHYTITGDTIINNTTFHKLRMSYKRYNRDQWGDCDYYSYSTQFCPSQYKLF